MNVFKDSITKQQITARAEIIFSCGPHSFNYVRLFALMLAVKYEIKMQFKYTNTLFTCLMPSGVTQLSESVT